ncbi:MAG: hypothetical protein SCALA702_05030 [Melioribacteraceae bacterium]|nr:MAG: hypothetical protein SCALA702_05030 [Melioribacteraceae bacterium]
MNIMRLSGALFLLLSIVLFAQKVPVDSELSASGDQGEELTPVFDINPAAYIVGPGDEFLISVRGVIENNFTTAINPEGFIFMPKIGLIDVNKLILADAKEKVSETIRKFYKDVEIDVTLINVRFIKIDVLGFVNKFATFTLPANTRLFELVQKQGELDEACDLRNILTISTDGAETSYDVIAYKLLRQEDQNPYLSNIKTVILNRTDQFVTIYGSVVQPDRFPFREDEEITNLIKLGGGFASNARTDTIEVVRFDENNEKLLSIFYNYDELKNSGDKLQPGDKVIIRKIPDFQINRMVEITGEVQYPGMYKIRKNSTTLYEVISVYAGGFTKDASLKDAYVERRIGTDKPDPELERLKSIPRVDLTEDEYDYLKARSRERKGRMVVDFIGLFAGKNLNEDLILKREDVIVIPEKIDFISIVGQVVKPGNIVYDENLSVEQYIEIAGGFSWRAIDDDIRVIKSYSGEWVELDDLTKLEPGDIIWVPEDPPPAKFWDVFRDTMMVLGQIAAVVTSVVAIAVATR